MAKNVLSSESKLFAFLAYLLGIIGFVVVLVAKKTDAFAMYHAKQSLVLFIAWIIVYVVGVFLPVIGWVIILPIGGLLLLILWVVGIVNALSGNMKPLPVIGRFGEKFKF
ncbi:MAG: DUF4870 domain-containing protein [Candidatus Woesearchaeota archaeon]